MGQSIKKNVLQNIKILSNTFNQNVYISNLLNESKKL